MINPFNGLVCTVNAVLLAMIIQLIDDLGLEGLKPTGKTKDGSCRVLGVHQI